MALIFRGGGGALVSASNAWDPAKTNAAITLSNLNLTTSGGANNYSSYGAVKSTLTGKKYLESFINVTGGNLNMVFGIANGTFGYVTNGNYVGVDINSFGYFAKTGQIFLNSAQIGPTIQTIGGVGVTICQAFDFDNLKAWFRIDAGNWNNAAIGSQDPANNIGGASFSTMAAGPYFAAGTQYDSPADQITATFAASFAFPVPAGFGPY